MSKQNWNVANDDQFEEMLRRNLPDTPPDVVVYEVAPWRKSVNWILVGLVLCAIQLDFLMLQYFLPTLGMFLLLLGFRGLRKENACFRVCWILSFGRMIYYLFWLIMNATIYQVTLSQTLAIQAISTASALALVVTIFCFLGGLIQIRRRTGIAFKMTATVVLCCCYVGKMVLAVWQVTILPIFIYAYVVVFFLLLYGVYKQSYQLDNAGYALRATPVKVSNSKLVGILLIILFVGIGCGYVFGGKYPMEWQQVEADEHVQVEDIKQMLIEKGFPEYVLDDLTAEDIAECEDALRISVEKTKSGDPRGEDNKFLLNSTAIAVELPDKRVKIIHHFHWDEGARFYGTEALRIWPADRNRAGVELDENWNRVGGYTGRVLRDNNGARLQADYYYLGDDVYISHGMFNAGEEEMDCSAIFSMPHKAENCRGYVAYTMENVADETYDTFVDSWLNYVHQDSRVQYPVYTAEECYEYHLYNWSLYSPYWVRQDALQILELENLN